MSRNTVIVLLVLCVGVAALIALSKKRPGSGSTQIVQNTEAPSSTSPANTSGAPTGNPPQGNDTATPTTTGGQPVTLPPGGVGRTTTAIPGTRANPNGQPVGPGGVTAPPLINRAPTNDLPEVKPLPVLEKDYASATNRDSRLDIMMDIAETPGAEAVRALTRLFEIETDGDLKVDLLDSLLGIDGFKEEKLIMLTMGARQGLPQEVRQSAIDGLIDLDDSRVIPVLNGLLNDSDPEIREGAQDALEMLQSVQAQPTIKLVK